MKKNQLLGVKKPLIFVFLLAIFFLIISPTTLAATHTETFDSGNFHISYPMTHNKVKETGFSNLITGYTANYTVDQNFSCTLQLFNQTGHKTYEKKKNTTSGSLNFIINKSYTPKIGEYATQAICEDEEGKYGSNIIKHFTVIQDYEKKYEEYNYENIYNVLLYITLMGVSIVFLYLMHAFKNDIGSSVAYGMTALTLQIITGSLILAGTINISDTFGINAALALLSYALGIYSGWYSTSLYTHARSGNFVTNNK